MSCGFLFIPYVYSSFIMLQYNIRKALIFYKIVSLAIKKKATDISRKVAWLFWGTSHIACAEPK